MLFESNPKNARAQWSEFSAIESDDDDDDNFLYVQSSVYHHNPADEIDDSLSDSSNHHNYKHNNLSSDLLWQEDEQMDSVSEREGVSDKETDSVSEREGGSDKVWKGRWSWQRNQRNHIPTTAAKNICSTKSQEEDL